ncbi:MAG: amidase [Polyangiaceae bacterium]|nr:amidase [Polyangiaceae bacterium]
MSPLELTLTELTAALRRREVSAAEVMRETLARIDASHDALNAIVARRDPEQCVADARAADERLARGEGRPLEGVPLAVKDLEDAAGLPTSHGSRLFAGRVASRSSVQVERLVAAGAVVVGKTNAPELGSAAITKNLVFGVTRSPWDGERSPGGSSGGAAAALAGEVVPLVTASDGGGSIRIPASFTGAFGLKPSHGRIPRGPLERWDTSMTAVDGPLTKTVADAALFLDCVAGPSHYDPVSLPSPGYSYLERLREPAPTGLRVGFSPDLGYGVVQSDVAAVVEEAARAVGALGHRLVPIAGGPPELGGAWGLLGAFELAGRLADDLDTRPEQLSRGLLDTVRFASALGPRKWDEIAEARARLVEWVARTFEQVDLLLTPTVPFDPPPARGPFPSEVEGRLLPTAAVAVFTIPFNLAWCPAATVRAGLSRVGLPVGLQIVGPRLADDLVLAVAAAFERARPWHPAWPSRRVGGPMAGSDPGR